MVFPVYPIFNQWYRSGTLVENRFKSMQLVKRKKVAKEINLK